MKTSANSHNSNEKGLMADVSWEASIFRKVTIKDDFVAVAGTDKAEYNTLNHEITKGNTGNCWKTRFLQRIK